MKTAKRFSDGLSVAELVTPAAFELALLRPTVRGKFIFVGEEKFYVRGVTYGTFGPNAQGEPFPEPPRVALDFAYMVACGINTVRTYTVPPLWLLDLAQQNRLRVLVGLPWEQHIAFLEKHQVRAIEEGISRAVGACGAHPAILAYTIGNEIPASMVRWYGHRRVERFLKRLYWRVKQQDPMGLVTYVNYPSTEYLQLPFLLH